MVDAGKILIIDSEDEHRLELRNVLKSDGFQIVDARSEIAGISMLEEFQPSLVILNLPESSARSVCARIKRSTKTFIPVLQLSRRMTTDLSLLRDEEVVADSYLVHPIEPLVLLTTVHSLLRLKKTSDSLTESEESLKIALSVSRMATWYWDIKSDLLRHSNSFSTLFGYPEDFSDWTYHTFIDLIYPADRAMVEGVVQQLINNECSDFSREFRIVWPDQSIHWLACRGQVLRNVMGQIIGVRGTFADVQKLKEAEVESREARELAEKANQAKTQFLANLSHEIRTPISAILGFTELLLANSDEHGRKDLGRRIRSNGNQLLRLIDDVLNLSKFEVGKIPIRKEAFSVTEIIYDVLKVVIPEADAKGIRIHSQFALNGLSIIYSDPVRFRQIITNLVTNAVKFSTDGKVDVRVLNQGNLVIEVEDHGIGMTKEEQKRIFQPFGQADASISKRFGGSGLGLALSKKIAQALGGDLELKASEPGRGSCFRVTIDPGQPLDRVVEHPVHTVGDKKPTKQLQGVRILLVDDSLDNEELIRFYLQHDGAKVEVAHNGYEAISQVESRPFDIVLMDVQMPEMDGLEATRQLRARGYKTPIIALTAHALREEVNRSLDAGCDAHLTKPITRKELVDRIRGQLIERSVWMNAPKHIM